MLEWIRKENNWFLKVNIREYLRSCFPAIVVSFGSNKLLYKLKKKKLMLAYAYHGILLSNKEESTTDTGSKLDEALPNYTEWKKSMP